jgi:hypothetical protein
MEDNYRENVSREETMGAVEADDRARESGTMIVTCYIEGRADKWEGVCLDFDLAVYGASFSEVTKKLDSAIHEYIAYVGTLPENDRARLLDRHVPLWLTISFMIRVLVSSLFRSRKHDGRHWNAYTVPCAT